MSMLHENMARYWFERFANAHEPDPKMLGPVMHAIQDASIPHHAAGYLGNWHDKYENDLEAAIKKWIADQQFLAEVKSLFRRWDRFEEGVPSTLGPTDWDKTPAANWQIDTLVTWVAINACREYQETYGGFKNGYRFDQPSARRLTQLAMAASMLVLHMASKVPVAVSSETGPESSVGPSTGPKDAPTREEILIASPHTVGTEPSTESELSKSTPHPPPIMTICPWCKRKSPEQDFCPYCGKPLRGDV